MMNKTKIFYKNKNLSRISKDNGYILQLCYEDEPIDDESGIGDFAIRFPEPNPFEELYRNRNEDLRIATLKNLGAIAKEDKIS